MKDEAGNPGPKEAGPAGGGGPASAFRPDAMNGHPLRRQVLITNPQGLHMRPSAAFAELAGRYQSNVTVHYEGKAVNGKSLWDLMLLAAMPNTEITLEVDGPDAPAALEALAALLQAPPDWEAPPAGTAPPAG
ncbi:MAG TPA: HPr family phosphocarrier protein [Gemmataceae bacterium]|jgi:phosphotransferase system HPr (HPr) family protein|nr:HPr family phosphocarrier protein [Gemmataceae bacterium]